MQSAHFGEFQKAMAAARVEGADLRLYNAEEVRKLM
jgi:hypothetical protein